MANAAVVIPVYKETLNEFEKISLMQVKKILGEKYPLIFVAPAGKNFSYFSAGNKVIYFPSKFFQSTKTYNFLMMSAEFYQAFLQYDYILIYQLDALVFSDKLEYFCNLGYDNIGAPWLWIGVAGINIAGKKIHPRVGNGGFCLRNVQACYNLLTSHAEYFAALNQLPEDVFWSVCGMIEGSGFKTAPISIAYKFSAEINPARCTKKNGGELPFGCHAWYKLSLNFYSQILPKLGYDLKKFGDYFTKKYLPENYGWLINLSLQRLTRRINRGQSLGRYLPKNNFASVRVIRNPYSMLILARLLLENNSLSDKIYFYDETDSDILLSDLKPEKLPHLLITKDSGTDNVLAESLLRRGFTEGNRFVIFGREYLSHCEKIFHNLGKNS